MGKFSFGSIRDQICRWKFWSRPVSPWLVLKPQLMQDEMVYRFYSFEEEKVVQWKKRSDGVGSGRDEPADASKIVGSSHGWLALFNESNNELFLSDPLKREHIKLPSIEKLPHPEMNLVGGRGRVTKLILSCSPDQDGVQGKQCRAIMSYGALDTMAFCSPSTPDHWIPVSDLSIDQYRDYCDQAKPWSDMVYCTKRGVFSSITPLFKIAFGCFGVDPSFGKYKCHLEDLDLSPKWVNAVQFPDFIDHEGKLLPSWIDKIEKDWPIQANHLVYVEESDTLYLLVRLMDGSRPLPHDDFIPSLPYSINNPSVISKYGEDDFVCKTVGFLAFRIDDGGRDLSVAHSLEGLAMFVGVNHSFAIPASRYPQLNLKPNSIYFTDVHKIVKGPAWTGKEPHDFGMFDYQNNIVSPLMLDESSELLHHHAPLWFTPSINVV